MEAVEGENVLYDVTRQENCLGCGNVGGYVRRGTCPEGNVRSYALPFLRFR